MEVLIHHWVASLTGGGFLTGIWLLVRAGILDEAGKWVFDHWVAPVLNKVPFLRWMGRKKRRKEKGHVIQIARLGQKVKDLQKSFSEYKRESKVELNQVKRKWTDCLKAHAECQADYSNLAGRVAVLERIKR